MGGAYSASSGLAVSQKTDAWKPNPKDTRSDGSIKGEGWLGPLKRLDNPNDVSSEISIGTNWGTGEKEIPSLVPGLTQAEQNYLLSTSSSDIFKTNQNLYNSIQNKAIEFAKQREKQGLPFFK